MKNLIKIGGFKKETLEKLRKKVTLPVTDSFYAFKIAHKTEKWFIKELMFVDKIDYLR